jgi:glycosyltransferase domain-containing protein
MPTTPAPSLTIVILSRNRPRHCIALARFLRELRVTHPILIADSSDPASAEVILAQHGGLADYMFIDAGTNVGDKISRAAEAVASPYIVMLPDDDVTFPHSIDASLAYLQEHADYVAAHGYTLCFGLQDNDVDVRSVFNFVPSIDSDRPLYRHFQLMSRYQTFIWAVFRTETFVAAAKSMAETDGAVFKELAFMSRAVLRGKVARVPNIFGMRGMELSQTSANEGNPVMMFLHHPKLFYERYAAYRDSLAAFVRDDPTICADLNPSVELNHVLDINHATLLSREINPGMFNYQAQLLLGAPLPPIQLEPQWQGRRDIQPVDLINISRFADRRYIWRRGVLEAEPRTEIIISGDEIATVEAELDCYRLT